MGRKGQSGVSHSQITVEHVQRERDKNQETLCAAAPFTCSSRTEPRDRPQRARRPGPSRKPARRLHDKKSRSGPHKKKKEKEKQINKTDELPPAGRTTFRSFFQNPLHIFCPDASSQINPQKKGQGRKGTRPQHHPRPHRILHSWSPLRCRIFALSRPSSLHLFIACLAFRLQGSRATTTEVRYVVGSAHLTFALRAELAPSQS